ncbi:unnamed protein product [Cyprideis torosa]|uniref:Uncharacterized protein n=1 Tax=Cyprideis torosa TaxID=163714 RepID=A0A7R8WC44_9CRUS|nr:unnamed protein product [Cyprideis torosa]CAG0892809.1 unnamed protein product [Cyprideis torosa]
MTSTLCRRLLTLRISPVVSAQARPIYTVKCPPIRMEWKLKLHWEEPKPVPVYNPFKSGDLSSFPSNMDTKIPILEIQPAADVLAKSDPVTQRLLSLEYAPRREVFKLYLNELIKKVQRHRLDFDSEEVKSKSRFVRQPVAMAH